MDENENENNEIVLETSVQKKEVVRFAIVGWDEESEKFLDFYRSLPQQNAQLTAVHTGKIKSEFIFEDNSFFKGVLLADSFRMDIDVFIMDKSFELIFLFGTPPQCSNISRKAIAIGKHVVCNKLVSLCSKEAHQLVDSLLSYPSLFCVVMNPLRSLPLSEELRVLLDLNDNKVRRVVCRVQSNVPVRRFNFYKKSTEENAKKSYKYADSFWYNIYSKEKGCGCLYEVTSYYIDFFGYVLQTEFSKVQCVISQLNCYPLPCLLGAKGLRTDCDDYNTVVLEYESGQIGDIVQVEIQVNCCTHMLCKNRKNDSKVNKICFEDVHQHSMQILMTDLCINVSNEEIDVCYFEEGERNVKIAESLKMYSDVVCKEGGDDIWTKGEKLFYLNVFESFFLKNSESYPSFMDSYKSLLMISKCKASNECKNWQYVESAKSFRSSATTPLKKSPSKDEAKKVDKSSLFFNVVKKAGIIMQLSSQLGRSGDVQNKEAAKKRQMFAQMSDSAEINQKSSS